MYDVALLTHNLLRWGVLGLGLAMTLAAVHGLITRRPWSAHDERLGFFFIGALDLELTVGLMLYLWLSPLPPAGFGASAADLLGTPVLLFFTVVHPLGMITGVVLVHVGHARRKATDDARERFRVQALALLPWLLIVVSMIPWPWLSYGRAFWRW